MTTINPISPAFDARDEELVLARVKLRDAIPGPRVGDFVRMPDGRIERFTYDWGTDIQTTSQGFGEGSHYLTREGVASYSGALDEALPKGCLEEQLDCLMGNFWIFHRDISAAHNGVTFSIPCRLFHYTPKA